MGGGSHSAGAAAGSPREKAGATPLPAPLKLGSAGASEELSMLCGDALGDLGFIRELQLRPEKLYAAQCVPSPHSSYQVALSPALAAASLDSQLGFTWGSPSPA